MLPRAMPFSPDSFGLSWAVRAEHDSQRPRTGRSGSRKKNSAMAEVSLLARPLDSRHLHHSLWLSAPALNQKRVKVYSLGEHWNFPVYGDDCEVEDAYPSVAVQVETWVPIKRTRHSVPGECQNAQV